MKTCQYCLETYSQQKNEDKDNRFAIVNKIRLRSTQNDVKGQSPNNWCSLWCQEHDLRNRRVSQINYDIMFYLDEIDYVVEELEKVSRRITQAGLMKDALTRDLYGSDGYPSSYDYWAKELYNQTQMQQMLIGKLHLLSYKKDSCGRELRYNERKNNREISWRH